jgi:hypothetical protein
MIKFSKVISTGIPVLILLYVFYNMAFNVPAIYNIDIGTDGDMDAGKDAYIPVKQFDDVEMDKIHEIRNCYII